MSAWLAVFLGGGLGSLARYGTGRLAIQLWPGSFPAGTLMANLLSCMMLALVMVLVAKGKVGEDARLFLAVGFCGGFSTFSTFSLETVQLIKEGHAGMALLNVLISVIAGMSVVWVIAQSYK